MPAKMKADEAKRLADADAKAKADEAKRQANAARLAAQAKAAADADAKMKADQAKRQAEAEAARKAGEAKVAGLMTQGQTAMTAKKYDDAIKAYTAALQLQPGDAKAAAGLKMPSSRLTWSKGRRRSAPRSSPTPPRNTMRP